ncbi:hypothetical protein HPG69_017332 [Diceros bicornis minor]|uniref:SMB domain-containing protein n=1 Tax=Diceros bicornis minor TaxID=77932 RepID=A0A7J7EP75_DICBM|nr:hypothetical protein HPG69_017332 [Diceros bicornis minor]
MFRVRLGEKEAHIWATKDKCRSSDSCSHLLTCQEAHVSLSPGPGQVKTGVELTCPKVTQEPAPLEKPNGNLPPETLGSNPGGVLVWQNDLVRSGGIVAITAVLAITIYYCDLLYCFDEPLCRLCLPGTWGQRRTLRSCCAYYHYFDVSPPRAVQSLDGTNEGGYLSVTGRRWVWGGVRPGASAQHRAGRVGSLPVGVRSPAGARSRPGAARILPLAVALAAAAAASWARGPPGALRPGQGCAALGRCCPGREPTCAARGPPRCFCDRACGAGRDCCED